MPINGILQTLQYTSSPFLSTFVLIHLTAPVLGNVFGSNGAGKAMILGREYYQTSFGESLLLFAPLGIHVIAGITRRVHKFYLRKQAADKYRSSPDQSIRRKWYIPSKPTLLQVSAYGTLLLLPIHILTNRVHPSLPDAPIHSISPGELDYEFVKYGFQNWPWRSWMLYSLLVACVSVHAAEGFQMVSKRLINPKGRGLTKWTRRGIAAAVSILTLNGLRVILKEPLSAFTSQISRYHAAYTMSSFYTF